MRHGTLTAYRAYKCRCEDCVRVAGRYQKRLRYEHQSGEKRVVDAAPAHDRIRELIDSGVTVSAIADALGFRASNSVHTMLRRPRIRKSTFDRVMSMPRPDASKTDSRVVSAVGTRRRLQALSAHGWSLTEIAQRTGVNVGTLCEIRNGTSDTVRQSTMRKVADVYDELALSFGPCTRAKTKAARNHWAPPMAWDDIDNIREKAHR